MKECPTNKQTNKNKQTTTKHTNKQKQITTTICTPNQTNTTTKIHTYKHRCKNAKIGQCVRGKDWLLLTRSPTTPNLSLTPKCLVPPLNLMPVLPLTRTVSIRLNVQASVALPSSLCSYHCSKGAFILHSFYPLDLKLGLKSLRCPFSSNFFGGR